MSNGEEKSNDDFYAVLGLKKECTATELRTAYKRLALRWHPDRCSASGNSAFVEEAKKKFQAIQQAYSVLSDANKRFLYDVGAYENDDDENGMGDFLNEMVTMMSQTTSNENGKQSFEELQELFHEMFQGDLEVFGSKCQPMASCSNSCNDSFDMRVKQNPSEMGSGKMKTNDSSGFDSRAHNFFLGVEHHQDFKKGARGGRRHGRKQKASSGNEFSSNNYGISTS